MERNLEAGVVTLSHATQHSTANIHPQSWTSSSSGTKRTWCRYSGDLLQTIRPD